MSEMSYTPPSPPPPPPPPPFTASTSIGYDFAKPFSFVFEDPDWVRKIVLGGLFYLAAVFIVGWFFLLGYCARLARNVINGAQRPLPEWDDLGDIFAEGLRLFVVAFLHYLPILAIAILLGIPAALVSAVRNESMQFLGSGIVGCMACLIVPFAFCITVWMPAALLRTAVTEQIGPAFEFAAIWQFIRDNLGNYVLAIAVYIVARFVGGFGIFLFCIGVLFTGFWALLVMTYGFAQVYRLRRTP